MQKIVLTQDAARRIVAAGSTSRNVCRQTLDASPKNVAPSRVNDVRPAVLRTAWTWSDDELSWTCKIRFIVDGEQAATPYDVYAPTFLKSTKPPITNYSDNPRVYVVWRGRWEIVSFVPPTTYSGGEGVLIDEATRTISNTGVLSVYVGDSSTVPSTARTGDVCFSDEDFVLTDFETDSVGWRGIALKTKPQNLTFVAGNGVSVDVSGDNVAIANTAPNVPLAYSQDAAGAMLPANSGVINSVYITSEARAFANVSTGVKGGTLTFTMPTGVPIPVVTDVSLNADGSLKVVKKTIYVFSIVT